MARGVFRLPRYPTASSSGPGSRQPVKNSAIPPTRPSTPGLSATRFQDSRARPPMSACPWVQMAVLKMASPTTAAIMAPSPRADWIRGRPMKPVLPYTAAKRRMPRCSSPSRGKSSWASSIYSAYTPAITASEASSWLWLSAVRSTSKEVSMMHGVTTYIRMRDSWDRAVPVKRPARPKPKPTDMSKNRVSTLPPTTRNASSIGYLPLSAACHSF